MRPYKPQFGAAEEGQGNWGLDDDIDAHEENMIGSGVVNPQISLPVPEAEARFTREEL